MRLGAHRYGLSLTDKASAGVARALWNASKHPQRRKHPYVWHTYVSLAHLHRELNLPHQRRSIHRLAATWLLGCLAPLGAHADAPVNGAARYAADCASSGCHGASPLTSNSKKIYNGRNSRALLDSAIGSVGEMKSLRTSYPSGGAALADLAAYLGNTPTSLTFASTTVGATAPVQTVTVYASLKSGRAISNLTVATTGDFARTGGTCGTAVTTGTNCTVQVAFTPTASGARTGTLSLAHNNTLTPVAIALSGTGTGAAPTAPVAAFAPASLTLASTAIGSTSAAQNVTVSNTGNAALSISAISLSNAADFVVAGGTCNAGGSVAALSSCTVSVAFKPAPGSPGTRSGTLSIGHNAAASPGAVGLTGSATAAAAPVAALTASLGFGSVNVGTASTAQTATLSNSGTAPLAISALSTGSTEFAISGGTCAVGTPLPAAGSCSINLRFTPSAAGARSASLVVQHNASGGQSSAGLAGTGVALNPVAGVSPGALSFSQSVGSTSNAQTVTVSNTGNAALTLGTVAIGGTQAAEYQIAGGSTCVAGASVAANASCVVLLSFTPAAIGTRSASLSISHNAAASPSAVALNGTGTAAPQAAISLNASAITFSAQTVGSSSTPRSVTVSNSGSAPLSLSALTLTGSAAVDFARSGTCSTTTPLAAGGSCTVVFAFMPSATGARTATLTLASNASNGSAVLSLGGTGAAAPAPAVGLAPGVLAFGNQTVGSTSTARTVLLTNSGSGALLVSAITAGSGFGVSHNCGGSVAAGASCTLSITFTPASAGAASGSVSVTSNAVGSPHTASVGGTGVASSPVLAWTSAPAALDFGNVTVGAASTPRSLTMVNQGSSAVTLNQLTLAGPEAGDFALGSGGSCALNASLAPGASCSVAIAFQPGAAGARSATLQVLSSGTNPPDVALAGTGTAAAQPAAAVAPTALNFNVAADAGSNDVQTFTLQSTGNAVLHIDAVRVVSGSFTVGAAAASGCPAAPFDLLPGASCALAVAWSSTTSGTESGLVEVDTNAAATPVQVAIQATREAPASPGTAASNAGAGGCAIAAGNDTSADPTLWILLLVAALVLWRRRNEMR